MDSLTILSFASVGIYIWNLAPQTSTGNLKIAAFALISTALTNFPGFGV
jgi:hypothetical protein